MKKAYEYSKMWSADVCVGIERRARYISYQRILRDFGLSFARNWYVSSYGSDERRLTYQELLLSNPNTSDRQGSAAV